MFRLRALSFLFGLPVMLWVCYAGGWWIFGAAVILALIALREWARAISLTQVRPNYILGGFFIMIILAATQPQLMAPAQRDPFLISMLALMVIASFVSRIILGGGPSALNDVSVTLLTPLYLGFLFSFLQRIRLADWPTASATADGLTLVPGAYFLILFFLVCWGMDTGAFLCGRFIGGPKLCPAISPGKTIAGLIGAIVTAALLAMAGFALLDLPLGWGLLLGTLMGVTGQLGDLSKSLIKREVGMKDFGNVFPGHGGVLDRFDNALFNAPLLYFFLQLLLVR